MKSYLSARMAVLAVGLGVLGGCGGGNGTSSLSTPSGGGTLIFSKSPVPVVGDPESDLELYSSDSAGRNERRLTTNTAQDRQPSVSRDGRVIVWQSMPQGGNPEVHIMNGDATNPRRLTPNGQFPTVSPDGKLVAFVQTPFIFIIKADGSGFRRFDAPQFQRFFIAQPISFKSDGKRIAFVDETDNEPGIYTVAPDGSGLKAVALSSPERKYLGGVSYGPNDEIVSGVRLRSNNSPNQFGLYIVREDGTGGRTIPLGAERPSGPVWSPNGKQIAYDEYPFTDNPARATGIIIRNADGFARRVINEGGIEPTWGE
jgi:TolB protein